MYASIFIRNGEFKNWGTEHIIVLSILLPLMAIFMYIGIKKWNKDASRKFIVGLCILMTLSQLTKPFFEMAFSIFDVRDDLPLHLCNLMPIAMLAAFYYRSRKIWAIFFFWIIAGSSQSLFTTTLTETLPHYEAIRYWIVHWGIVLAALYGRYVMKWGLYLKDILYSILAMHIAAAFLYPLNVWLNSNYFYLNGKPPGKTLYSAMPEWPYYILVLEVLLPSVFGLVYFIFRAKIKNTA